MLGLGGRSSCVVRRHWLQQGRATRVGGDAHADSGVNRERAGIHGAARPLLGAAPAAVLHRVGEVDASSVEDVLEQGLRLAGASPVHIAFRGTANAGSVRCEWRGMPACPPHTGCGRPSAAWGPIPI